MQKIKWNLNYVSAGLDNLLVEPTIQDINYFYYRSPTFFYVANRLFPPSKTRRVTIASMLENDYIRDLIKAAKYAFNLYTNLGLIDRHRYYKLYNLKKAKVVNLHNAPKNIIEYVFATGTFYSDKKQLMTLQQLATEIKRTHS